MMYDPPEEIGNAHRFAINLAMDIAGANITFNSPMSILTLPPTAVLHTQTRELLFKRGVYVDGGMTL